MSVKIRRRKKKTLTRNMELATEEEKPNRPTSLELTNTETKLVVLDFLSSQSIEHLSARSAPEEGKRKSAPVKVCKSASDVSSHEPASYRKRYAKLAESARPLRKQYSLRLRKDLDEYDKLKQRGKSLEELASCENGEVTSADEANYTYQRSFTEGDAYFKRSRKISSELQIGITEFSSTELKHVPNDEKPHKKAKQSKRHRPDKLDVSLQGERRISPILSPGSQVAARLEMISQEIVNEYPEFFDEHMSKVSLQDLTYKKFASNARKLLEKYPGGWTRVALVCYFARELALEDESTDEQLEHLVEFSSKFISETSAEWIASQGGWGALEENDKSLSPSLVRKKLKEEPDLVDGILVGSTVGWLNYVKYGIAALAVGITCNIVSTRM